MFNTDIVLGIFHTPTFNMLHDEKGLYPFPFYNVLSEEYVGRYACLEMIIVKQACNLATTIHFSMEDITFPLNPNRSVTCRELILILSEPNLLNKTIFYSGRTIVPTDVIIDMNLSNGIKQIHDGLLRSNT